MLKNYLLVALRTFYRQKIYALVNLTGLVIALTVSVLAILYIHHELSFEREIPNQENILRYTANGKRAVATGTHPIHWHRFYLRNFPKYNRPPDW